jgi:hypothetical protein
MLKRLILALFFLVAASPAWGQAPVGYWTLNGDALDHSGGSNNGTWYGTQTGTSGYYSPGDGQTWAGTFDGSTDYVDMGEISLEAGSTQSFTLRMNSSITGKLLFAHGADGSAGFYLYGASSSTIRWELNSNGSDYTDYTCTFSAFDGNWHDLALTNSSGTVVAYGDGNSLSCSTSSGGGGFTGTVGTNNLSHLYIGNYDTSGYKFSGLMQSVRIYGYTLSASQVADLHTINGLIYSANLSESNTASDGIARLAVHGRRDSETNTASDAISRMAAFGRTDSETNTTSDAISRRAAFGRTDSETNTTSDSLARLAGFGRSDSESNTASDALARVAAYLSEAAMSETNTASDEIGRSVAFERAAREANTALDALARMAAYGRVGSETNVATDAVGTSETVPGTYSAMLYETYVASDAIARMVVYARSASEVNAASDALTRLCSVIRAAAESNPASDSLLRLAVYQRNEGESNPASDLVARSWGGTRALLEAPLPISDSLSRIMAAFRGDSEILTFSDVVIVVRGYKVIVLPRHQLTEPGRAKTGAVPERVKTGEAPVH